MLITTALVTKALRECKPLLMPKFEPRDLGFESGFLD